jgi:hypothetical protein
MRTEETAREQTATKDHQCAKCLGRIPSGTRYLRVAVIPEGLPGDKADRHIRATRASVVTEHRAGECVA